MTQCEKCHNGEFDSRIQVYRCSRPQVLIVHPEWDEMIRAGDCPIFEGKDEYRRCPFCGSKDIRLATRRVSKERVYWAMCAHCRARSDTAPTETWAKGLWNKRDGQ